MNPNREELLFGLALTKPADERGEFLDRECRNDTALRARLDALLAAHEAPDELLATTEPKARATIKLDLPDAPDEAVGQTLGRYKLLERVGEGGCGVVYVAEQTEPVRRRVALKVIKLGMDTKQVVARFEAERQALAMMDHPNIAKVLDAGTTDVGRPFFVMELVRGIRITDYCDQANLSTKERLDLFIKVCQAIQHAHQKGIIHRDIKPSNILVTLHDGVPVPKVIDFGIAKATEGRLTDATVYTQLHQFIGTPAYMSPEQAEMSGLDIDTRSDIYSLGVLLYELLAGSTPFDAKELMASGIDAMRKMIREKEPMRPSTRVATLGADQLTTTAKRRSADTSKLLHQLKGDLDWIVMKAMEKDRTRRYETVNGLAMDLKRHLDNEPVVARPPSSSYRFQKLVRRNKLAFGSAALVTATLILGIAVSTWQAIRATRAEREQVRLRIEAERGAKIRQQVEAREKIALATMLFDRGDLEGAGRLIGDLSPASLDPTLANAGIIHFFGKWNVIRGRPKEAIEAFQIFLRLNPEGGEADTTSRAYLQLACLLVEVGDDAGYEQLRRDALARFEHTQEYLFVYRTAQLALLRPASPELCDKIGVYVHKVEGAAVGEVDPWKEFLGALFEYRRRNHTAVILRCKETLNSVPDSRCAASALALLAASEQSVNHPVEARAALAKCEALLDSDPEARNLHHLFWFDWRFARFFLHEAQGLIEGKTSVRPTKP